MCICGAIPDRTQCGTCAVPPEHQNADDPTGPPGPPLDYGDEEPF